MRQSRKEWIDTIRRMSDSDLTPVPKKKMPLMDIGIIREAIQTWGADKMYTQLVEECGEYVTEACHLLFRPDRPDDLEHFLEEVVGVRIAVDHVIALHQKRCEEIYIIQINKEIAAMRHVTDRIELLSVWGPL